MQTRYLGALLVALAIAILGVVGPAHGQENLEQIEVALGELAQQARQGIEDLEACDDSFDKVTTERPEDDDSATDWLAYGKLIGEWYLACKALEAGDPAPVMMLALRELIDKIPPAPVGPNAVDPAAHLRVQVRDTRSLIERLSSLWNTMLGRYDAEQEAVDEHTAERERGARTRS